MLMRPTRHRRHGPVQLDLFQAPPTRPHWRTLPTEARQRVQQLLAQLLAEHHAERPQIQDGKGASDE
jgi:hypothetical protein